MILQGPTGCGKNALLKAFCTEKGFKLDRFYDYKYLENEDVSDGLKTIGSRYYPTDLSNLIDFIRKNCTTTGSEHRIVKRAAPTFSSFCTQKKPVIIKEEDQI